MVMNPPPVVLSARDLVKEFSVSERGRSWFRAPRRRIHALAGVSFDLRAGETLGIVGESGSGKTTLARVLMGLEQATSGAVYLCGERFLTGTMRPPLRTRRLMQMVFQDPYSSLDPWMTVYQLVSEPWIVHRNVVPARERRNRVAALLEQVGIDPADMDRRARKFSGGQRQRIGIARALALEPRVLILDEPVSSLDVSIQAQIVELLRTLQETSELAMLFIAHDLGVVRNLAHRVAVMYMGRVVEEGVADRVYLSPRHPYTKALLSAIPAVELTTGMKRIRLEGEIPSPLDPPSGCRFRTRCWKAQSKCAEEEPPLFEFEGDRRAACFFPVNLEDEIGYGARHEARLRSP
jgi:oligopeptide transport system ATP-binding protein